MVMLMMMIMIISITIIVIMYTLIHVYVCMYSNLFHTTATNNITTTLAACAACRADAWPGSRGAVCPQPRLVHIHQLVIILYTCFALDSVYCTHYFD